MFTHDALAFEEDVVVEEPGDYLLVYNDVLTASNDAFRANPIVTIEKNGVAVPGAQAKTHYVQVSEEHNLGSASLVGTNTRRVASNR